MPVEQEIQVGLQQRLGSPGADPFEDGARDRIGCGEGGNRHHLDAGQITRIPAQQETAPFVAVGVRVGALLGMPDPAGEGRFRGGDPVEQPGDRGTVGE